MPPKTACPVSLTQFMEKAEPLRVSINGQEMPDYLAWMR